MCKFNVVGFVGACIGEAGGFNSEVGSALLGLIVTSNRVVFAILSRVNGRVHKSNVGSLYLRKIMVFLYMTSHFVVKGDFASRFT